LDDFNDFTQHMDMLYKTALTQARDEKLAEELVQETYLHTLQALRKGAKIQNPRAYLLSVLRNRFFMYLRGKYKLSTTYFGDLPFEVPSEADFGGLERSQEAEAVRRELAFLSHTYREVMVRYYMKNQKVEQIAAELSIPKGTVLSRLDTGRKKIKEGIQNMDNYSENSYSPQILTLGMNGRMGQKGEPFSCVKNSLDQNVLIVAYENPLTVAEISRALGTPMAFVEESVNNLVDAQLMKREGQKVATDFFISSLEDKLNALEAAKLFAKETFDRVNQIILQGIKQYDKIEGFSAFNPTQKYLCAALSLRLSVSWRLVKAITGKYPPDNNDLPDRPNYGKWEAIGSRYPHGHSFNGELGKYSVSGRSGVQNINDYLESACEWNSALGPIQWAQMKYSVDSPERVQIIEAVRTNTVNAFQAELLPDMERHGLIKEENDAKVPAVPYITKEGERTFFDIERELGDGFSNACLDELAAVCKANKVNYPKRIPFADNHAYNLPLNFITMAYVYEAARRDIITIKDGKYYPVMYLVKR